jgi:hypothetical protein
MQSERINYPYVIIMKVGPYCGYSMEEIIEIKRKEEFTCGNFFWGYGGVFCHPKVINTFLYHSQINNSSPLVLFSTTPSSYRTSSKGRFTHFSSDKTNWRPLRNEILLVGNKKISHFAVVGRNLKKVNKSINLSDYCTVAGMFPNTDKYLDEYFRYRVDKACGIYFPRKGATERLLKVDYISELTEPYCVHIK